MINNKEIYKMQKDIEDLKNKGGFEKDWGTIADIPAYFDKALITPPPGIGDSKILILLDKYNRTQFVVDPRYDASYHTPSIYGKTILRNTQENFDFSNYTIPDTETYAWGLNWNTSNADGIVEAYTDDMVIKQNILDRFAELGRTDTIMADIRDKIIPDYSNLTEVSNVKSGKKSLEDYAGVDGQLVVNREDKRIHIMDGKEKKGMPVPNMEDIKDYENYTNALSTEDTDDFANYNSNCGYYPREITVDSSSITLTPIGLSVFLDETPPSSLYSVGGYKVVNGKDVSHNLVLKRAWYETNNGYEEWQVLCKLPVNLSDTAIAVHEDFLYVFGGADSSQYEYLDKIYKINKNTGEIITLETKLPYPKKNITIIRLNDSLSKFYLMGGTTRGDNTKTSQNYIFDATNDTLIDLDAPTPAPFTSSNLFYKNTNDVGAIFFNECDSSRRTTNTWHLDIKTKEWSIIADGENEAYDDNYRMDCATFCGNVLFMVGYERETTEKKWLGTGNIAYRFITNNKITKEEFEKRKIPTFIQTGVEKLFPKKSLIKPARSCAFYTKNNGDIVMLGGLQGVISEYGIASVRHTYDVQLFKIFDVSNPLASKYPTKATRCSNIQSLNLFSYGEGTFSYFQHKAGWNNTGFKEKFRNDNSLEQWHTANNFLDEDSATSIVFNDGGATPSKIQVMTAYDAYSKREIDLKLKEKVIEYQQLNTDEKTYSFSETLTKEFVSEEYNGPTISSCFDGNICYSIVKLVHKTNKTVLAYRVIYNVETDTIIEKKLFMPGILDTASVGNSTCSCYFYNRVMYILFSRNTNFVGTARSNGGYTFLCSVIDVADNKVDIKNEEVEILKSGFYSTGSAQIHDRFIFIYPMSTHSPNDIGYGARPCYIDLANKSVIGIRKHFYHSNSNVIECKGRYFLFSCINESSQKKQIRNRLYEICYSENKEMMSMQEIFDFEEAFPDIANVKVGYASGFSVNNKIYIVIGGYMMLSGSNPTQTQFYEKTIAVEVPKEIKDCFKKPTLINTKDILDKLIYLYGSSKELLTPQGKKLFFFYGKLYRDYNEDPSFSRNGEFFLGLSIKSSLFNSEEEEKNKMIFKNGDTERVSKCTGSNGEFVINSETKRLHLMDGKTPGGTIIPNMNDLEGLGGGGSNCKESIIISR